MIRILNREIPMSPLVERELLAGGRRKAFYWLRGGLAVLAGLQGYDWVHEGLLAGSASRGGGGGGELLQAMASMLYLVAVLMGTLAADSINRERREGTLGLLLITGLSPLAVMRGKLFSCGVTCFLVLLGALPALVIPVLIGGARGSDGIMMAMGILNVLFASLAAGLWMSACFRERWQAVVATLALVGALCFGGEVLGSALLGADATPFFRLLGLGGWITICRLPAPLVIRWAVFAVWWLVAHAVGWCCLLFAAESLSRNWQEQPQRHHRPPPPPDPWADWAVPAAVPARAPAWEEWPAPGDELPVSIPTVLPDPRPWDAHPIRWRMEQLGSPRGLIWIAVLADFLAQFGLLGGVFNPAGGASSSWGLFSFAGVAFMVLSSALLAWAAARFFQHISRQQEIELLLTTPAGASGILSGQWGVLWRGLRWPIAAVLALVLPAGISLGYDLLGGHRYTQPEVLPAFLIGVNLALEVIALSWVGVVFGLRSRTMLLAMVGTVGVVQIIPLAAAIGATWAWRSLHGVVAEPSLPSGVPALLFFLVKNLAFWVWAPWQLRRDLRIRRTFVRTRRGGPPARGEATNFQPLIAHRLARPPGGGVSGG